MIKAMLMIQVREIASLLDASIHCKSLSNLRYESLNLRTMKINGDNISPLKEFKNKSNFQRFNIANKDNFQSMLNPWKIKETQDSKNFMSQHMTNKNSSIKMESIPFRDMNSLTKSKNANYKSHAKYDLIQRNENVVSASCPPRKCVWEVFLKEQAFDLNSSVSSSQICAETTIQNINDEIEADSGSMGDMTERISNIDDFQVCSEFCRNLSAEQEKHYILSTLKILSNKHPNLSPDTKISDIMTTLILSNPGDRRYLVSSSWLNKWWDYVNFNMDMPISHILNSDKSDLLNKQVSLLSLIS